MAIAGVIFDLFGTLVSPFRRREHIQTMRACAGILGLEYEVFHREWVEIYPQRVRGEFSSLAEGFDYVARRLGTAASDGELVECERVYLEFTRGSLAPLEGVVETLEFLRSDGVRIGLVSNCAADVPRVWSSTALAGYFDYTAFSCDLGTAKPQPEIYFAAIENLGLSPGEILYVGDGSDEELTGAVRCGLKPILVRVDLTDTYDPHRRDVELWSGESIRRIPEVLEYFGGLRGHPAAAGGASPAPAATLGADRPAPA